MGLIYYFDIGNTRAKFWRCREASVEASVALVHGGDMQGLVSLLPDAFFEKPAAICGASVLSMPATEALTSAAKKKWHTTPLFAQSSASFDGLESGYKDNPERLGIDRWLGLIGMGKTHQSACLVSCGTALTCDLLRSNKHAGGYILPGLRLMPEVLLQQTHGVRLESGMATGICPGANTVEAVLNGALLATVALIERVVTEQGVTYLVLTGGDAKKVSLHLKSPHVVEPDLILRGLRRYFAYLG